MQKNQFIPSVHSSDTVNYSPVFRLATPIFDHVHPKDFQSPFTLHEFIPASKKIS